MDYKIVSAISKEEMEKSVNALWAEWKPVGGLCCVMNPESSEFYFYQAMVKRT